MTSKLIFGLAGGAVLVAAIFFALYLQRDAYSNLDAFAQCLAENGAVMYGTYSCPYCAEEKRAFGDAFRLVPYVECTKTPNECVEAGVNAVPTWIFKDGRKFEGLQGLERLAEISGCELQNQK